MIRNGLVALTAAMLVAAPSFADEITIDEAIEGASLHDGRLDMVVYYQPVEDDLLEVTATFAPKAGGDPMRVVMALADSDSVAFAMPGYPDSLYAFSRSGAAVTVSVEADTRLRPDAPIN